MKSERISSKHNLYCSIRVIDEFNLLLYFFLCHVKLPLALPCGKHEFLYFYYYYTFIILKKKFTPLHSCSLLLKNLMSVVFPIGFPMGRRI